MIVITFLSALGPAQAEQGHLHGSVNITYQSKYVLRGFDVYGDKSAIGPSISTDFDLDNNFVFTQGVYHQVTMDKSVNPDKDETWVTLSMRYDF